MKANIIKLSVLVVLLISSLSVFSQDKAMISGKILSTEKEIVDFATVYLKGTSYGGTTNQEGIYHIKAPAGNYTLIVSAIGYKTVEKQVKLIAGERVKQNLTITPETQQLDEVVVVGYGTQKKAHLTGAIATVPMDDIQDISSGSLANTLSGLVNGVSVSGGNSRPGENARITIRQNDVLASMGNNNLEPLYVIDGYIYPTEVKVGSSIENLGATAFNNLDPSMIEGISVLKDAAAAVYGARAAYGVVLLCGCLFKYL